MITLINKIDAAQCSKGPGRFCVDDARSSRVMREGQVGLLCGPLGFVARPSVLA